jgi:hypothetical protein
MCVSHVTVNSVTVPHIGISCAFSFLFLGRNPVWTGTDAIPYIFKICLGKMNGSCHMEDLDE